MQQNIRTYTTLGTLLVAAIFLIQFFSCHQSQKEETTKADENPGKAKTEEVWVGPNIENLQVDNDSTRLIKYGYELIANTSKYLGPHGSVAKISNGMNCQNCHLAGGTTPWGNNYGKVYTTYPKFRSRNDGLQTVSDRVNDCFIRSLNGEPLDTNSREMKAIESYIKWLAQGLEEGEVKPGTGLMAVDFLDRPASPEKGEQVYVSQCVTCHGEKGEGHFNADSTGYAFPPLWGPHSYNDGAGLHRLSRFTGFVKNNMPFGATYKHPILTDEEAWDVAAFVNSQPRPHKDQSGDWHDISKKPIDYPFGPYVDSFPVAQHKYGPFGPIETFYKTRKSS